MFEKMTDGDVMIYLRNTMLALSQLAQERQIGIRMNATEDGYFSAIAEDYSVTCLEKEAKVEYAFEPIGKAGEFRSGEWCYNISPQSIRFGQPPKEKSHGE